MPADAPRGSVLVVDDYEPFGEMLRIALELAGFAAVVTPTGRAALAAAAAAGGVDVAVVDLGLPDMSGVTVAEQLLDRGLAGRCVLMSGRTDEDVEWPEGWTAERNVLLKPYSLGELLERIAAAVAAASGRE